MSVSDTPSPHPAPPQSWDAAPPDLRSGQRGGGLALSVWLRLLTCATLLEAELRGRLRDRHGATLPRFDFLAQLDRASEGITLGEAARRMMVTNGNVTGLAARLTAEGLVERVVDGGDRRATRLRLTATGRAAFAEMAESHRGWVAELLAGLDGETLARLFADLGALKSSAASAMESVDAAAPRAARPNRGSQP